MIETKLGATWRKEWVNKTQRCTKIKMYIHLCDNSDDLKIYIHLSNIQNHILSTHVIMVNISCLKTKQTSSGTHSVHCSWHKVILLLQQKVARQFMSGISLWPTMLGVIHTPVILPSTWKAESRGSWKGDCPVLHSKFQDSMCWVTLKMLSQTNKSE